MANTSPILAGQFIQVVSEVDDPSAPRAFGATLNWLTGGVVVSGLVMLAACAYVQCEVMPDPRCVSELNQRQSKQKSKLSMWKGLAFLARSRYIRALALLVIYYGMSMNILETTWKAELKLQYPDPNAFRSLAFGGVMGTGPLGGHWGGIGGVLGGHWGGFGGFWGGIGGLGPPHPRAGGGGGAAG